MCKIKYGEMDTHRLNISLLCCCFPSLYISEICLSSADCFNRNKLFPWSCFHFSSLGWGMLFKWLILKICFGSKRFALKQQGLVCPMSNQPMVILKRLYILFSRSPLQSKLYKHCRAQVWSVADCFNQNKLSLGVVFLSLPWVGAFYSNG